MSPAVTDYSSALAFLYGRINYERTPPSTQRINPFKLDRFRKFLQLLDNPQDKLPAVHIAGTKGKGSTAQMVAGILSAAGLRTGLYTSPHLEKLEERFVIAGRRISAEELTRWTSFLQPWVERDDQEAAERSDRTLTFFEITTALALLAFVEAKVEIAILEVGLGGRLDSTNICRPVVCGITSISLDHTKQLGDTVAAIAREKAGIIKPGVPIVSGVVTPQAREVIQQVAAESGAPLWQREEKFDFVYRIAPTTNDQLAAALPGTIDYREELNGEVYQLADLSLAMPGEHQGENAATAVALVRRLQERGYQISEQAIRDGLAGARCPARVEWIAGSPPVVLDTAHNAASIEALLESLQLASKTSTGVRPAGLTPVLVFSASRDKDVLAMLQQLLPRFAVVFLTRYLENPRAIHPAELQEMAQDVLQNLPPEKKPQIFPCDDPREAFRQACEWTGEPSLVVVTGSFFLAAELGPLIRASRDKGTFLPDGQPRQ